jgi:cytochrome P450
LLIVYQTDEADLEVKKPTVAEVVSEGALAIIAGADTTATVLTSLIFLLLTHPDAMDRVKKEIDSVYPPGSNALDTRLHSRLLFLDACL